MSENYTSHPGGDKLTATMTLGNVGGLDLSVAGGGGYRIDLRLTSDQCDHFEAPACPTAAGLVEATDNSTNRVFLEVAKGDKVLTSRSFAYKGRTRMRAEVTPKAELDWIDIDDTQTANIELGGTRAALRPDAPALHRHPPRAHRHARRQRRSRPQLRRHLVHHGRRHRRPVAAGSGRQRHRHRPRQQVRRARRRGDKQVPGSRGGVEEAGDRLRQGLLRPCVAHAQAPPPPARRRVGARRGDAGRRSGRRVMGAHRACQRDLLAPAGRRPLLL